jgi:hypothetical protein
MTGNFSAPLRLCGALFIVLLALACHREQPPDPSDPYRDVPARERESLRTAVGQFADFQKAGQAEKMYDLLEEPREPKEKFLRRRAAATANLIEFYPASAAWIPEFWTITGCGVWAFPTGATQALVSSTRAKSSGTRWTLTPLGIEVFPEEPGHVKACSAPNSPQREP